MTLADRKIRWPKNTPNVHISTPPCPSIDRFKERMLHVQSIFCIFNYLSSTFWGLAGKGTSKEFKMPPKPRLNVQNFPRPPLIERTNRHLQIKWHGQTIADTKDAYWVLETYHAPSIALFLLSSSSNNHLLTNPSLLSPNILHLPTPDAHQEVHIL